jgi:hypothetical protein
MIVLVLVALMPVTGGAVALCIADQDKGAQDIEIAGGKRGDVQFPHRRHQEKLEDCNICHSVFEQKSGSIKELKAQHQEKLEDCNICHSVFEQKSGSIKELKAQRKLKPKHVMNKLCTKCHKAKKRAGEKTGPTTCKKCHIKK